MASKRISNIDTISALIDRLITERIKLYFFELTAPNKFSVLGQKMIIAAIKRRLKKTLLQTYKSGKYKHYKEFRTFDESKFTEDIAELVFMDVRIGEADRARLQESMSDTPDFYRSTFNEIRLRMANESRARLKNEIDNNLSTDNGKS